MDDEDDELTTCEQKAIILKEQFLYRTESKVFLLFFRLLLLIHGLSAAIHQRWSPSVWNFQFFLFSSYPVHLLSSFSVFVQMFCVENCFIADEWKAASKWLMKNIMRQSDTKFPFFSFDRTEEIFRSIPFWACLIHAELFLESSGLVAELNFKLFFLLIGFQSMARLGGFWKFFLDR